MSNLAVGSRVKYSAYALEFSRNRYLDAGRISDKERAKRFYEREKAKRGTVTAVTTLHGSGFPVTGYEVTWDDGAVSQTLDSRIEEVKE